MAEPRHERSDIRVGLLAKLGAFLAVLTVVVVFGVLLLFRTVVSREAGREEPRSPLAAEPSDYSGPKLQVSPPDELEAVRAAEREHLSTYGWVDPDAGVVRIPIEQAIDLIAARGLPSREEEDP
jgi:hypothetical protein